LLRGRLKELLVPRPFLQGTESLGVELESCSALLFLRGLAHEKFDKCLAWSIELLEAELVLLEAQHLGLDASHGCLSLRERVQDSIGSPLHFVPDVTEHIPWNSTAVPAPQMPHHSSILLHSTFLGLHRHGPEQISQHTEMPATFEDLIGIQAAESLQQVGVLLLTEAHQAGLFQAGLLPCT